MKSLTLLRHAKSGWDERIARDFDRPLNAKGRRAARAIGAAMAREGLAFDRVVASPALRVSQTIDEAETGFGGSLGARYDERLYLAPLATLIEIVHEAAGERLLIVGHNPGLEQLALELADDGPERDAIAIKYPTGTLVEIELPVAKWADAEQGAIVRMVRPRDLDPGLGPEGE